MRNEDLKTRLIDLTFEEIKSRVIAWRERRANYVAPKPKAAKRKTATKRKSATTKYIESLTSEQAAALMKELENG